MGGEYMKKVFITLILVFSCCVNVYADDRYDYIENTSIYINGEQTKKLNDDDYFTFEKIKANDTIEIYSPSDIKAMYIIYYMNAEEGNITYSGHWQIIGENGFLHEYVEIDNKTKLIDITYKNDVTIKEIFLFDKDTPSWVEKWQKPCENADVLMFPTHGDDEHIFFAGLIPKMVGDGKKIQVAYFVKHTNWPIRYDEQLTGLWTAGLRNYPLFGVVPDAYSKTLNTAIKNMQKSNMSVDEVTKYVVDTIRRFKPKVVVAHDENGEYGHGQHRLSTYIVENAVQYLMDENYNSSYDPYMPYKIYIHLYKENTITMDYDIPLDSFGGQTAFRVSMNALKIHESQKNTRWNAWRKLSSAKEIKTYSPMYFGLYYSSVGYENEDNNLFYNIPEKNSSVNNEEKKQDEPLVIAKPKKSDNEENDMHYKTKLILMILVIILLILNIIVLILKRKEKKSSGGE